MAIVKVDLEKKQRQFDEEYSLDTVFGVLAFLDDYHKLRCRAEKEADFGIVDSLVDLETALKDAPLTPVERRSVKLAFIDDLGVSDAATELGLTEKETWVHVSSAAGKLVPYLRDVVAA